MLFRDKWEITMNEVKSSSSWQQLHKLTESTCALAFSSLNSAYSFLYRLTKRLRSFIISVSFLPTSSITWKPNECSLSGRYRREREGAKKRKYTWLKKTQGLRQTLDKIIRPECRSVVAATARNIHCIFEVVDLNIKANFPLQSAGET